MTITKDDIYTGIGDLNKKSFVETSKIADELENYAEYLETTEITNKFIRLIKTLRGEK